VRFDTASKLRGNYGSPPWGINGTAKFDFVEDIHSSGMLQSLRITHHFNYSSLNIHYGKLRRTVIVCTPIEWFIIHFAAANDSNGKNSIGKLEKVVKGRLQGQFVRPILTKELTRYVYQYHPQIEEGSRLLQHRPNSKEIGDAKTQQMR